MTLRAAWARVTWKGTAARIRRWQPRPTHCLPLGASWRGGRGRTAAKGAHTTSSAVLHRRVQTQRQWWCVRGPAKRWWEHAPAQRHNRRARPRAPPPRIALRLYTLTWLPHLSCAPPTNVGAASAVCTSHRPRASFTPSWQRALARIGPFSGSESFAVQLRRTRQPVMHPTTIRLNLTLATRTHPRARALLRCHRRY